MRAVTQSEFRQNQSQILDDAQREPISVTSRGRRPRAVVVSPDFFIRAREALEDQEDIQDADNARAEVGFISHDDLKQDLGID